MKKINIMYIVIFMFSIPLVLSYSLLKWEWFIFIWPSSNINVSNAKIDYNLTMYDTYSNDYKNFNKRQYFQWTWVLVSDVYGDFDTVWKVDLIKSDIVNLNCVWENVSYYYSWSFLNNNWWKWFKTLINNDNYYCPDSWKFSIKLTSLESNVFFEDFILKSAWKIYDNLITNNPNIILDERVIFSNEKLAIWWLVNKNVQINNEFQWWTNNQKNLGNILWIDYNSSVNVGKTWTVFSNIYKNIIKYTKWKHWENNIYSLSDFSNDLLLYDFEWQNELVSSNMWNEWRIFTLNNLWGWLSVVWEKTLIIKWWNLYIKDDIYNKDTNSVLTIIVLRDTKNKKNWWNVYIDPWVTNIDSIIISEWSLLSYNSMNTLNSVDNNANLLRNQLLIYGSLISKNTIWENKSVFNTDDYISNNNTSNQTNKYNLENLRTFKVVKSDQIEWINCNNIWKITAIWLDELTPMKYSFAWKKECYYDDITRDWLRATYRTASTVIEYNPIIQTNTPKIIRVN